MFKNELVLRNVRFIDKGNTNGKLASNWEGPYKINISELEPTN